MRKNSELFKAAISGGDIWKNYVNALTPDQLVASQADLIGIVKEVKNHFDNTQIALEDIAHRLNIFDEEREQSMRRTRKKTATKSLRRFLDEPVEQSDGQLSTLDLCTKTGAAVRLDALTFMVSGRQQEVTTVNDARRLFQQKHNCGAYYSLYYVRDGHRSAGFGWDRPFLDELFLV